MTIRENSCTSSPSILTLTVTDPDKPEQGPFTFDFEQGGNPLNGFTLQTTSNSTQLICNRNFDREVNPYLKVVIKATDTPSLRQSSTANVFIEVEDEDEFPARTGRMRIIVNAIDGKFVGGPIGKTYFEDDDGDEGSSMEYTLTGSDEFTIKKDDGWISAKSTVKVGNYQLRIQGSKPSANERPSCVVDVIVREVPKEAIQHSAAIQLRDVWNEKKFLNPISIDNEERYRDDTYYDDFVKRLAKLFVVPEEDVFVFSIQMSAKVMPGRQDSSLDVRFAIRKDSTVKSKFLPRYVLINELEKSNDTLQNLGEFLHTARCVGR